MNQHYIEYLTPGSFVSNEIIKPVSAPAFDGNWPKNAFAYRFFARTESECDGEILRGPAKTHTPWVYQGQILTLDDIPDTQENSILRSNMRINCWKSVVRTALGQYFPLMDGDTVRAQIAARQQSDSKGGSDAN